ncbi:hypothetical protein DFJ43DRAFT_1101661 [Lentinula guzmanii]|uniref:Uncharacterized protein n=1 Tax=Lentinula guzmanii TaxID=2804957 RepID=A0AA38J7Y2_9AGAR|nr:hypothetical protein DFJ43DRAFT_1101661 [Lentinula guzmanii]
MIFPEELLHAVVGYIAYNTCFIETQIPELRWKYARSQLLSLSLTARQFRRLSFPFLFAHIEIRRVEDIKNLVDQCALNITLAASIRTLDISVGLREEDVNTLHVLLSQLIRLSQLNWNSIPIDLPLLNAINRHPLTAVLMTSMNCLPSSANPSDLTKIVLKYAPIVAGSNDYRNAQFDQQLYAHLNRGMCLLRLSVGQASYLGVEFGARRLNGLREIDLTLDDRAISELSWLRGITDAHPHLWKIRFLDLHGYYFINGRTISFVQSFLEDIRREGLEESMSLKGFAVTRTTPGSALSSRPINDWQVTGLNLKMRTLRVLKLAHERFPQTTILTLSIGRVHVDDFMEVLCRFSSLQVVNLSHASHCLHFGKKKPWTSCHKAKSRRHPVKRVGPVETESAMIWYTSRIARRIPTIDAFYIEEYGYDEPIGSGDRWEVLGWINAHELRRTHGQLPTGTLRYSPLQKLPQYSDSEEFRYPKYYTATYRV